MIVRVILPAHLRNLARTDGEVRVDLLGNAATWGTIVDAIEASYPPLGGTIRDHATKRRRPFVRFFACSEDFSNVAPDHPLPEAINTGAEPFIILGAIAGG